MEDTFKSDSSNEEVRVSEEDRERNRYTAKMISDMDLSLLEEGYDKEDRIKFIVALISKK